MREEEIDKELAELDAQRSAIKEQMMVLVRERDAITTEESAQKKALAMSPAERKALGIPEPQVVSEAGGIQSEESVQG
jgi:regulator of replication initiation timing